MQIYFMKKEKIPIPVSTVILMIVTITYKLVLVVIGLGILLFGRGERSRRCGRSYGDAGARSGVFDGRQQHPLYSKCSA